MRSYNDPPTGASKYGRAALENETAKILAAPHGGRHMQIFRGACSVFELAAGGEIDPGFAHNELLSAGISVGKPEREVRRILKDARKRGFRQPRRAPESGRYSRRYVSIPRPAPPPREPEPEYMVGEELERIFAQGNSVLADDCVAEWLTWRDIDPNIVASEGLAVSLPSTGTYHKDFVPHIRFEGEWHSGPVAGLRCLVPYFDIFGERRGGELLLACTEPPLPTGADGRLMKRLALRGARARLVMANPVALGLLRGEDVSPTTVVITEGPPDFLTAAVENPQWAHFGVVQGSWQPMHAVRMPPGADIIIATDQDTTGEKIASTIIKTLAGRQYGRWRPRNTPSGKAAKTVDVNDCGGIGGGIVEWHK